MIERNTLTAERNIDCNKVIKRLGLTVVEEENDDDDYAYVRDNRKKQLPVTDKLLHPG